MCLMLKARSITLTRRCLAPAHIGLALFSSTKLHWHSALSASRTGILLFQHNIRAPAIGWACERMKAAESYCNTIGHQPSAASCPIRSEILHRAGSPPISLEVRFELFLPEGVLLNALHFLAARLDSLLDVLVWVGNRLGCGFRVAFHKGFIAIAACKLGEIDDRLPRVRMKSTPRGTYVP